MANWYDSAIVLRDFADAMVEAGAVEDPQVIMSKPYKFTTEYTIWKSSGYPSDEEDEGWAEFISGLNGETDEEEDEDEQ